MAPPSTLAIKTSAVLRIIKEIAMYKKDLVLETNRLEKMTADPSNDKYALKQQVLQYPSPKT